MNRLNRIAVAMLTLMPMLASPRRPETTVLIYRSAEPVMPVLQPLIEPGRLTQNDSSQRSGLPAGSSKSSPGQSQRVDQG